MKFILPIFFITLIFTGACRNESTIMGDKYFEQGEYQKAIDAYNNYLEINPRNIKSIYNRGRSYEELGNQKKAMSDFEHVLKLDPKNVSALLSIGKNYYREENYDQALFFINKALEINDEEYMGHYLKGRVFHKQGMVRDAMDEYNTAISLNPKFGDAYLYRGALRLYMRQKNAACGDFQMAMNLDVAEAKEAYNKNCK